MILRIGGEGEFHSPELGPEEITKAFMEKRAGTTDVNAHSDSQWKTCRGV